MMGLFNSNRPWTLADDTQLLLLATQNTPTSVIALKLGRTEAAVYARAAVLGISLMPLNRSPYGRS